MSSSERRTAYSSSFFFDTLAGVANNATQSATSVRRRLSVTESFSIAEETGASIRAPARVNNLVGIAPTQELVSRDGMIGAGLNTRVGPIARTVEDAARILDVIADYDPLDELTIFSVGRTPPQPYATYAREQSLTGVRIGIVRECMDKALFTVADHESIDIVDRAIADLRRLGAEIVDPGLGGQLFGDAMR